MSEPMFSIIIPCYNVEDYIESCINSVLCQTFQDFEVLLIDDGSTDRTQEICLKKQKQDSRIQVISKKNEGLSATRNRGMSEAKGKYIVFLDSDDYIEDVSLERINDVIQDNTEVVITRLIEDYGNERVVKDEKMQIYFSGKVNYEKVIRWVMIDTENTWPSVKYVVKNDFLKNNNLLFKVGFIHEDMDWTTSLFSKARNVSICYYPWYHHRMKRKGSITNVVTAKRITDVIQMGYDLIDGKDCVVNKYPEELRTIVINRIMQSVYETIIKYKHLSSNDEKKQVVNCAEMHRGIFRFQPKVKFKIFMVAVKIIGFQKSLSLYSILYSIM